ncbi:MAG: hypothetical protein HWD61_15770 [Parachlamydiaceae bacterium]|nr:MAG: hypothetical protein HWD61_15770 [Parachlamydiaceae bacterium]
MLHKEQFFQRIKKARYGKQALKEFLNYLKRPNFSSKGNYSFAENMVEILTPKFSKELICELNEFFLFNKDQPEGLYEFRLLIRIAKLAYKFHPAEVLELIKNTIQTMLSDRHEIKAGKELLILECIKFLAQIDLSNAVEYRNILQSKLNILIAQGFNLTFNSLDWALLETLAMIDPSILKSYENLLLNYSKKKLAIFFSILGTARSFENILDLVEKEQNESLKTTAIYMLLRRCHNEPIEPLQFIEETIDSYHSEDVLLEAAVAYARIGELEKALEIIDRIEDPYSQTTALIQIAEIYAPLDIQKTLQVLEKLIS